MGDARSRHAELVAIAAASEPGDEPEDGLTLVSTLEPRVMCLGAALELRFARVVYGLEAPPNGGVSRVHDPARMPGVVGGVLRDECRDRFVRWLSSHRGDAGGRFVERLLHATGS